MIRCRVYLNPSGEEWNEYHSNLTEIDLNDINESHMTLLTSIGKRHNFAIWYVGLIDEDMYLGHFEEDGSLDDSASMVIRFLKRYMPKKKDHGNETGYCYINIPKYDNKYFVVRKTDVVRFYDIHVELHAKYILGKNIFIDKIFTHMNEVHVELH